MEIQNVEISKAKDLNMFSYRENQKHINQGDVGYWLSLTETYVYPERKSLEVGDIGFHKIPNLEKKSNGKYVGVFFNKPGVYSLVKIYRAMRDENHCPNGIHEKLPNYFCYPKAESNGRRWDQFVSRISDKDELGEDNLEALDILTTYNDCYVPIVYIKEGCESKLFTFDKELKLLGINAIPGVQTAAPLSAKYAIYESISHMWRELYEDDLRIASYNLKTKQICNSVQLDDMTHKLLKGAYVGMGFSEGVQKVIELDITSVFLDNLNAKIKSKGYSNLKIESAIPCIMKDSRRIYEFAEQKRGEQWIDISEAGYLVIPSYNGVSQIGSGTINSGFVIVSDDENCTMLGSAWCQRATSWSHSNKIIDQEFKHWSFPDWFMGPFAEMINLNPSEAKFIFKGREVVDKSYEMEELINKLRGMKEAVKDIVKQPNLGA